MLVVDYINNDEVELISQALWAAMSEEDRAAHDRGEPVDFTKYLDENRCVRAAAPSSE